MIAAKSNKLDNVKAILMLGADVNHKEVITSSLDEPGYLDKLKVINMSREISHKVCICLVINM